MDPLFKVETLKWGTSPYPNRAVYLALHQDYSEDPVFLKDPPSEEKCASVILNRLLKGKSLHAGPLEHPVLLLNFAYFPHSVMQQMRTHRNVSFDVQSNRYSGQRIVDVLSGKYDIEEVFYLRPIGEYTDRSGKKYEYLNSHRQADLDRCYSACGHYRARIREGFSEEHARGMIPFDVRQHWVMSANARALMHLLDMRWPADAQLEAQQLSQLMFDEFRKWMPEVAVWYLEKRARKSMLSF